MQLHFTTRPLIKDKELGIVVIPYVSEHMRLILAAQVNKGAAYYDEYVRLCNNPVRYFREKSEYIIQVLSPEGNGYNRNNYGDGRILPKHRKMPDNNDEIRLYGKLENIPNGELENDFLFRGMFGIKLWNNTWEFRFKNLHYDKLNDKFCAEINEILEKNDHNFKEILEYNENLAILRRIYKDNFLADFNDTSMAMLSGPLVFSRLVNKYEHIIQCRYDTEMRNSSNCKWPCSRKTNATLLLGDLKNWKGLEIDFLDNDMIPIVVQLPHHGAKSNTDIDPRLCKRLCKECRRAFTLVASYGLSNKYGHPDLSWLNDVPACVNSNAVKVALVNERNDFSYTILF